VRIGIDLLDVARFGRVAAHPAGRRIVFTPAELAYADTLAGARRAEHLAGRFCAKEATAKLLGSGFGQGLVWRDIEIARDARGAPGVRLRGGARRIAERLGIACVQVSLSHQSGLAICAAVAVEGLTCGCDVPLFDSMVIPSMTVR